jgi:hypothetical protein
MIRRIPPTTPLKPGTGIESRVAWSRLSATLAASATGNDDFFPSDDFVESVESIGGRSGGGTNGPSAGFSSGKTSKWTAGRRKSWGPMQQKFVKKAILADALYSTTVRTRGDTETL